MWRSHSGGLTADWERVQTGYPVLGVSAIALDPTDSPPARAGEEPGARDLGSQTRRAGVSIGSVL